MRRKRSISREGSKGPVPVQEAIQHLLEGIGLHAGVEELRILACWDEVVGEQVGRRAKPDGLKGGRLYVIVEDPVWLHQLSLLKPTLIASLNERLGFPVVKELYLKVGKVPPALKKGSPSLPPDPSIEVETLDALLAQVRDLPCEEVLRRLLGRALTKEEKRHPVASPPHPMAS